MGIGIKFGKLFAIIFGFLFSANLLVAQSDGTLYFSMNEISELKNRILSNDETLPEQVERLRSLADWMVDTDPVSITSVSSGYSQAGPNDYFSEGPYWWPDPEDESAPYIRKDGQRNPDRFLGHKKLLMRFYAAVTSLGFAAYLFDNQEYAAKAVEYIDTWCNDPATKMNPHLKFAQIIRNKPVKRGVGIIDTHRLTKLMEALNYLKLSGYWNKQSYESTKKWFSEFGKWLTESEYGIDEKERGNNHSSWWAAQVAVIADFTGDSSMIPELYEYATILIDSQITAEGRQPHEEARTLSLNYSTFNLNALSVLGSVLLKYNMDIFKYENQNGSTILDAMEYLLPYIKNPDDWELKQIKPFKDDAPLFLGIAGIKLNNSKYLELYTDLLKDGDDSAASPYDDPFEYMMDIAVNYQLRKAN